MCIVEGNQTSSLDTDVALGKLLIFSGPQFPDCKGRGMTTWVLRCLQAQSFVVSSPGCPAHGTDVFLQFSLFPPVLMADGSMVNASWLLCAKSEYCLRILLNTGLDYYY